MLKFQENVHVIHYLLTDYKERMIVSFNIIYQVFIKKLVL